MRISRGNQVIGELRPGQVKKGLADESLLSTDMYYDEETSDWLPLGGLMARRAEPKPIKALGRPCYCGSGLPFTTCHGDGSNY